ncbi:MAG: hypothetical protein Q4G13_07955 [Moraxella sp.]|nr:hypothetical protein [Moraxella sp.]
MQIKNIETCDFEFDRKKQVTPKSLQRFKDNAKKQSNEKLLDDDIVFWLSKQDNDTKHHISEMIRHAMQLPKMVD